MHNINVLTFISSRVKVEKNRRGEGGVTSNNAIFGERRLQDESSS